MNRTRTWDKPCDDYSGNLCGGFGGETICWMCGWDLYEHRRRSGNQSQGVETGSPRGSEPVPDLQPDVEDKRRSGVDMVQRSPRRPPVEVLTVPQLVEENDRLWPNGWMFHRCPNAMDEDGNPRPASHDATFHDIRIV